MAGPLEQLDDASTEAPANPAFKSVEAMYVTLNLDR